MNDSAAQRALDALIEGNRRFANGACIHPRHDAARRCEISKGQHPFAAVVACSDSRVCPEIVFDQGLGDLFIVRTAGNVLDETGIGSLEYAAAHLGVPLIIVMGHSRCGAIEAALADGAATGAVSTIILALAPSIARAKESRGELAVAASQEHVRSTVAMLERREPVIKRLVAEGGLRIAGVFYDVERGTIELV
jgi:carbonic anhydrase